MSWAWAELVFEVKCNTQKAPFNEDKDSISAKEEVARRANRGQLAQYAAEIFRRQHREFVFVVSICKDKAWLLRFDRSEVVYSKSFNYVEHPEILAKLLYRLFHSEAARAFRGHDRTASLASPAQAKLFHSQLHKFKGGSPIYNGLRTALTSSGWPIYCLEIRSPWAPSDERGVQPEDPVAVHYCLVGRPIFPSISITGRGTRGFVAYDETAKRVVFIKDQWRPDIENDSDEKTKNNGDGKTEDTGAIEEKRLSPELEHYHKLWSNPKDRIAQTRVPTVLGGGDVVVKPESAGGKWTTQRTHKTVHKSQNFTPRVHTRLIIKEVCAPLDECENFMELVQALRSAVQGERLPTLCCATVAPL